MSKQFTLGLEEEFQIVDPYRRSTAVTRKTVGLIAI